MWKTLLLAAGTVLLFGACSDELVESANVVKPTTEAVEEKPIVFGSVSRGTTRADFTGAEAAKLLGNQFVVSGYKGASTKTVGNVVFDNYVVKYIENSAHTTELNTNNWEYVGMERIKHAIDNGITQQSAKYWDLTKNQYDFIAWSTGTKTAIYEGTPAAGQVLVSAITPNQATGNNGIAYTFEGRAADLTGCYIADLVTVKKAQYGDDPVTIKFRSLGTKVRIGLYETIPGYSVRNVQFYIAAAGYLPMDYTTPRLFSTTANDIYTRGKYTIYYPTVDNIYDADNNQAHIRFEGTGVQSTVVDFGPLDYTIAEDGEKTRGKVYLGRSSNTATMAGTAAGNYYTQYLPNEWGTNLNLRVNYTLESIDGTGEVIEVKGATAQVPSIYTQWKAGFAYTYLFKISDRTNGHTGEYNPLFPNNTTINSDPAGLYPITFDAVVVDDEESDQTQETITTVSAPSITTYQKGSNVLNQNEYNSSLGRIYVTVNDTNDPNLTPDLANGTLQTLTGKVSLFRLPEDRTEADVVDAMQMQDDDAPAGTVKGRNGLVMQPYGFTLTNTIEYGVDGNTISVGTDQALAFQPASGTMAFVYTKKAPVPGQTTRKYQPVTFEPGAPVSGYYRYAYKPATTGDVKKDVMYFANATSGVQDVFLGQQVNNLYLNNEGSEIASGYAQTGTTYYYTTDNGMSYKAAAQVEYASFRTADNLYYLVGTNYVKKTEEKPANGRAYYRRTGLGTPTSPYVYTYCVIYPQQADGLRVIDFDSEKQACTATETAVSGMTYFDMYTQNNGVYYAKVIKIQ